MRSRSSSEISPSFSSCSSSWRMWRRTLRTATRPSSARRLHDLHELLAPVGGELGEREPDDRAVVGRGDADVARLDRLLDRLDRALVVRRRSRAPAARAPRSSRAAAAALRSRSSRPAASRRSPAWRGRCGSPANSSCMCSDGLVHLLLGLVDLGVHQRSSLGCSRACRWCRRSARGVMLPGCVTSNTMIGSELSMQNVIAVESITCRPRWSTSM